VVVLRDRGNALLALGEIATGVWTAKHGTEVVWGFLVGTCGFCFDLLPRILELPYLCSSFRLLVRFYN
jgi:hypothetical protein